MRIYSHNHDSDDRLNWLCNQRVYAKTHYYPRRKYTDRLDIAWELQRYAPYDVILWNMSWLELPSTEVARQICRAFLDATDLEFEGSNA